MTEPTTLVQLPKRWRRAIWTICGSMVVMFVVSTALGFYFADRSYQRTLRIQREFCGLIVQQDNALQQTTPPTQRARDFATALHKYRIDLGC